MTGLFDQPLSQSELDALPSELVLRYWAGSIADGVDHLSPVTREGALKECRDWLAFVRRLSPGQKVRVRFPGYWANGRVVEVADTISEYGVSIKGPDPGTVCVIGRKQVEPA